MRGIARTTHMFAQGRQSLHHCDAGAMSMSIGDRMDER
jgi:hypothetical protein